MLINFKGYVLAKMKSGNYFIVEVSGKDISEDLTYKRYNRFAMQEIKKVENLRLEQCIEYCDFPEYRFSAIENNDLTCENVFNIELRLIMLRHALKFYTESQEKNEIFIGHSNFMDKQEEYKKRDNNLKHIVSNLEVVIMLLETNKPNVETITRKISEIIPLLEEEYSYGSIKQDVIGTIDVVKEIIK